MSIKELKPLIQRGKIATFNDIFKYVTADQVAAAMQRGVKQVEAIRKNHNKMTLGDFFNLGSAIDINWKELVPLFPD